MSAPDFLISKKPISCRSAVEKNAALIRFPTRCAPKFRKKLDPKPATAPAAAIMTIPRAASFVILLMLSAVAVAMPPKRFPRIK
jgi:hypothetical protein